MPLVRTSVSIKSCFSALLLLGFCGYAVSCVKDKPDSDTIGANYIIKLQQEDNNVTDLITSVLNGFPQLIADSASLAGVCAAITYPDTSTAKTLIIDFGSTGCGNPYWDNGKMRSGVIKAQWSGNFFKSGTVIHVTTKGYKVDNTVFDITQTLLCVDTNTLGELTYKATSIDTLWASGVRTTWKGNMLRVWNNNNTLTPLDDRYFITGSGLGIDYANIPYSYIINDTLLFNEACKIKKIAGGHAAITPQGHPARYIYYGNNDCTPTVQVTINNINYSLILY